MAWDKVTKIDTIAKRKAWSKVNEGVLVEHRTAYHRVAATIHVPASMAQMTTQLGKGGKLRRAAIGHGHGSLITNWARGTSARTR